MDKTFKAGAIYNPDALDRDKIFTLEELSSSYYWCLHCERTYLRGEFRPVGDLQMCPYSDCDGDAVIDAWDWNSIRETNPDYPEVPVEGAVYPMYGTRK